MAYTTRNEVLEHLFTKQYTFSKSAEPLSRNRDPNMTPKWHVWAICRRPEVDCDLISDRDVKTFAGNVVANFEVASSNSFLYIKKSFRDGGGGGGGGHRRYHWAKTHSRFT